MRSHPRGLLLVTLGALLSAALATTVGSLALFTDSAQSPTTVSAGRIFPGVRTTAAFLVGDASGGGAETDRSSPFVLAGDGRTVTTGPWSPAFASDRYLAFDLNAPLPAGIPALTFSLQLTLASAGPSGTTCTYVEVRQISNNASLATYGSPAAPLACVTGAALTSFSLPLPILTTTDAGNDLRIRLYGRDSAGVGSTIDEVTVTGATPYSAFTLYPVRFTDAATSEPVTAPWDLQGP